MINQIKATKDWHAVKKRMIWDFEETDCYGSKVVEEHCKRLLELNEEAVYRKERSLQR
jgi:hypothetical protein